MLDLLALTEHLPVLRLEPGDELLTEGEVEVRKGDVVLAVSWRSETSRIRTACGA